MTCEVTHTAPHTHTGPHLTGFQFEARRSATLRPPGEARLEPSQKSKNFGLYLASPPRPELGSWKSTHCRAFTSTAKAHYSDRPSCGRKSKIFRFWGRAPRGLFTASSDRLGRDILTFWSESEFERSQKKIPRDISLTESISPIYPRFVDRHHVQRGQNPWENR